MKLKVSEINWEMDREVLLDIEDSSFGERASDASDLRIQLDKGLGLIVADKKGPSRGYVIAIPLEKAPYAGCIEDRKPNTTYIESVAVKNGSNPLSLFKILKKLGSELKDRGYTRTTMHVESGGRLYNTLTKLGASDIGSFENWMGWGKTFSYLELNL